jgi:hypothetical protein
MNPADDIKKYFKKAAIRTNPEVDRKVLDRMLGTYNGLLKTGSAVEPRIWRKIMKSNITKFAAAAVVVIAVAWAVYILGPGTKSAYAITDTIAALRHVKTVHATWNTVEGKADCWVKLDPNTGENQSWCIIGPDAGDKWVHTPKMNNIQKGNDITLSPPSTGNILHYGHIMEYLAKISDVNSTQIRQDLQTGKSVIVIVGKNKNPGGKSYDMEAVIDPDTKLLIRATLNGFEGFNSIENIKYDEPLPADIFNFEIPPNANVKRMPETIQLVKFKNDPNFGMEIGNLAPDDARKKLAQDYWAAAIAGNYEVVNHLTPVPGGTAFWQKKWEENKPVELISTEIQKAGANAGVLCKVKFDDGVTWDLKIITLVRDINGDKSMIVIAMELPWKTAP